MTTRTTPTPTAGKASPRPARTTASRRPEPGVRTGRRTGVICLVGVLALVVLVLLSLAFGSEKVPLATVVDALTNYDVTNSQHVVVVDLRVPRTAVGIVAGIALGAAGALIQAVTRNPLAEPGLLGVNSGASAVIAVGILMFGEVSLFSLLGLAFLGAAVAGGIVLLLGGAFSRTADPVRLVLAGAAMSVVLGSIVSALLINYPDRFAAFRNWDAGAVGARPWGQVIAAALLVTGGILLTVSIGRSLDAMALGSQMGVAMGANPRRTWLVSGVAIIVLCGSATALAGPIGFLGLVAPILGRRLVGPSYHRLLPVSMLLGACILMAADVVGRVIIPGGELQAAIVCALIGGPAFVAVARRRRAISL